VQQQLFCEQDTSGAKEVGWVASDCALFMVPSLSSAQIKFAFCQTSQIAQISLREELSAEIYRSNLLFSATGQFSGTLPAPVVRRNGL
jgi:hypothetical protein